MVRILSFDIGIVNMAYCIIDKNTKNIIKWEVFSLVNSNAVENTKDLVRKLDERKYIFDDVGIILLERQPKVNPKMKQMASTLRSYLIVRGMVDLGNNFHIVDYSPKYKLMCWDGPVPKFNVKSEYTRRKKLGIFQCEQLIKNQSEDIQKIYNTSQKKKDDLADCFLQGLSYILFEDQRKKESSNIIKRKPTSKQMKYNSLSKSNLKYLFDEFLKENHIITDESFDESNQIDCIKCIDYFFEFNPRVLKIFNKFYGTQTERISELISPTWTKEKFKIPQKPVKKRKTKKKEPEEEFEDNED